MESAASIVPASPSCPSPAAGAAPAAASDDAEGGPTPVANAPSLTTGPAETGKFFQGLAASRDSAEFSDVTIVVSERRFPAHRVVLSAWSTPLRAMLAPGRWSEGVASDAANPAPDMVLEEVNADTFSVLLEFVYCGTADLTPDNVLDVLEEANRWAIAALVDTCSEALIRSLDVRDVAAVLTTADRLNIGALRDSCMEYCATSFTRIEKSKLANLSVELVKELCARDDVTAAEEDVFLAAAHYIAANELPPGDADNLLSRVRFAFIPNAFLVDTVQTHPVLGEPMRAQNCQLLMRAALWQSASSAQVREVLSAQGLCTEPRDEQTVSFEDIREGIEFTVTADKAKLRRLCEDSDANTPAVGWNGDMELISGCTATVLTCAIKYRAALLQFESGAKWTLPPSTLAWVSSKAKKEPPAALPEPTVELAE